MKKLLIFCIALISVSACRPDEALGLLDAFQLELNTDIFNYSYKLNVLDENGEGLSSGLNVTLEGDGAAYIYTEFGDKNFGTNVNGELTFVLDPKAEPVSGRTVSFIVNLTKEGFESSSSIVTFQKNNFRQEEAISLQSFQAIVQTFAAEIIPVTTNNGALSGSSILGKRGNDGPLKVLSKLSMDTVYYDTNAVSVLLQDGAKFNYMRIRDSISYRVLRPFRIETLLTIEAGTVNGVPITITTDTTIYEDTSWVAEHHRIREYLPYTGERIDIITKFKGVSNPIFASGGTSGSTMSTLYSGSGRSVAAVRRAATVAESFFVMYNGLLDDGTYVKLIPLRNDVIYSMKVDESSINPSTNVAWQEGDSLEVGRTYGNGVPSSRRVAIRKAANGELRMQTSTKPQFAGYYEFMPFETPFDITLNTNMPDTLVLPDFENLRYTYQLRAHLVDGTDLWLGGKFGNRTIWFRDPIDTATIRNLNLYDDNLDDYSIASRLTPSNTYSRRDAGSFGRVNPSNDADNRNKQLTFQGNIFSDIPVARFELLLITAYWDGQFRERRIENTSGQATYNLFSEAYKNTNNPGYKDKTNYNVSVVCTKSNDTRLWPTATASTNFGGTWATASLKNGRWGTRGIEIGDTMTITIAYNDWGLDTSFVVMQPITDVEYRDETGLDVCDL